MGLIRHTADFAKATFANAEGGHDWFHTQRVWKLTHTIGAAEGNIDMEIAEPGALLHDIADPKFHDGDEEIGPRTAYNFLTTQSAVPLSDTKIENIVNIVRHISYSKNINGQKWMSPELAVVQDADRLEGMGAIGIARTFNYGGHKGRMLYDPDIPPNLNMTTAEYRASTAPTINHFYEKLLLLKDGMNTETGRKMAEARHVYMEQFLEQFFAEWNGER